MYTYFWLTQYDVITFEVGKVSKLIHKNLRDFGLILQINFPRLKLDPAEVNTCTQKL